jgi:hypothetical protein
MSITYRAPFVDLRQQTPGYSMPNKVTSLLANLKIPAIKKMRGNITKKGCAVAVVDGTVYYVSIVQTTYV